MTKICVQSLKEIFLQGPRYQKAGVIFQDYLEKENMIKDYFYERKEKSQNLMKAIDKTNFRFGRSMITVADTGLVIVENEKVIRQKLILPVMIFYRL